QHSRLAQQQARISIRRMTCSTDAIDEGNLQGKNREKKKPNYLQLGATPASPYSSKPPKKVWVFTSS
ncbi:hypothetical protein U1Q18_000444, partial [Sarracenia purpurea var. burkii]